MIRPDERRETRKMSGDNDKADDCAVDGPLKGVRRRGGGGFRFDQQAMAPLIVAFVVLSFCVTVSHGLECYECVGKSCQDGFGKARVCTDKIDTCVTIYANETSKAGENVLARNCSLPWMKWEGECHLVQPSGNNSPRAKLKGYMCLCKGNLCNGAMLPGASLQLTIILAAMLLFVSQTNPFAGDVARPGTEE
jgi:hypothetical protein